MSGTHDDITGHYASACVLCQTGFYATSLCTTSVVRQCAVANCPEQACAMQSPALPRNGARRTETPPRALCLQHLDRAWDCHNVTKTTVTHAPRSPSGRWTPEKWAEVISKQGNGVPGANGGNPVPRFAYQSPAPSFIMDTPRSRAVCRVPLSTEAATANTLEAAEECEVAARAIYAQVWALGRDYWPTEPGFTRVVLFDKIYYDSATQQLTACALVFWI